jgi:hypothetical protein
MRKDIQVLAVCDVDDKNAIEKKQRGYRGNDVKKYLLFQSGSFLKMFSG